MPLASMGHKPAAQQYHLHYIATSAWLGGSRMASFQGNAPCLTNLQGPQSTPRKASQVCLGQAGAGLLAGAGRSTFSLTPREEQFVGGRRRIRALHFESPLWAQEGCCCKESERCVLELRDDIELNAILSMLSVAITRAWLLVVQTKQGRLPSFISSRLQD